MITCNDSEIDISFRGTQYYLNLCSKDKPISNTGINNTGDYYIQDDTQDNPYFVVYVTDDCNMRCSYCFNELDKDCKSIRKMPQYSSNDFVSFLNRNYKDEDISLRFFGGEPLLNKEWIYEFVNTLKKENIKVAYDIFTNATMVDDKFIEFAKSHKFRFYVSINGGADDYKGKYFVDSIWTGIEKLLVAGFNVIARMVWIPNKEETLINLVSDAVYHGVKTISITPPWGNEYDIALFKKQVIDFADFYIDKILTHDFRFIGVAPFVSYIAKWILNLDYNSIPCAAGKSMVSIATDGKCYPCHCFINISDYLEGTVYDTVDKLFMNLNADTMEPCRTCSIRYFCKGKCAADAYFRTGDCYRVDPQKCETEKELIGASAYILYKLQQNEKEYMGYKNFLNHVIGKYNNNQ